VHHVGILYEQRIPWKISRFPCLSMLFDGHW